MWRRRGRTQAWGAAGLSCQWEEREGKVLKMCSMYMCMGVHDACYSTTAFIMDLSENCRNTQLNTCIYTCTYTYSTYVHALYYHCVHNYTHPVWVYAFLLSSFAFSLSFSTPAIPALPSCHTCPPILPYLLSSSRDAVLCASWPTMEMALSVTRELQNLEAWGQW